MNIKRIINSVIKSTLVLSLMLAGNNSSLAVTPNKADQLKNVKDQLQQENTKIQEYSQEKTDSTKKVRSLSTELASLDSNITNYQRNIDKTVSSIKILNAQLKETEQAIISLEQSINNQKELVTEYINNLYSRNEVSLFNVILSQDNFSDLVGTIKQTGNVQKSLMDSIISIEMQQKQILKEKKVLFDKRDEQEVLQKLQNDQQSVLLQTKTEKNDLLQKTKGEESQYARLLKESQDNKKVLIQNINLLASSEKSVGLQQAYEYAKNDAQRLGGKVRPEFLVGLLKVESNLGANVGSSLYKDALSGCAARPGNNTARNFSRDEQLFEKIVSELSLPLSQPVSGCPYPKYKGTGGAIGPAQFMPSTWIGYKDKLVQLKKGAVSPWNIEDALLAMALKVTNMGTTSIAGNNDLERNMAKAYLGGGSHEWYADAVLNATDEVSALLGL